MKRTSVASLPVTIRAGVGTQRETTRQLPRFLAGDILLFGSTGDAFSNVGRWLMKGEHEGPTYSVHTGQFLDSRRVLEMDMVARIATIGDVLKRRYWQGPLRLLLPPPIWADLGDLLDKPLRRVPRFRRYWQSLWKPRGFEVWRCSSLTPEQRSALTYEALTFVNARFSFVKFSGHAIDDIVSKVLRREVFIFRRIDPEDRHPVCSGITASVYDKALHYRFGVEPQCADPDQIHDWVRCHPAEWTCVYKLVP